MDIPQHTFRTFTINMYSSIESQRRMHDEKSAASQLVMLPEIDLISPVSFEHGLDALRKMPHQSPPFVARNWGHRLHSLCSYASKMKPGLAHWLVRLFTRPGDVVLDPFSGSGTIPFEACMMGRTGMGTDLSPLAFCVTSSKVNPPNLPSVENILQEMNKALQRPLAGVEPLSAQESEIIDYFHLNTFIELQSARQFLLSHGEHSNDPALQFVRSCLAHIMHGNRPYALSRRSHGIIPIPPKGESVYKPLMESLIAKVWRTRFYDLPSTFTCGRAEQWSASSLSLEDSSVDCIITSPPFFGSTEFIRQNRLRLWLLGWNYQQQAKIKSSFLEYSRDILDYTSIAGEMVRVLKPRGLVIMHLGVVKGRDMALELAPLFEQKGMVVKGIVYEDTSHLESHGRTDRGGTAQHQFLFMQR